MHHYDLALVNTGPNVPRLEDGRLLKPPPLGILMLAAYLELHGYAVQILDYQHNTYPLNEQLSSYRFVEYLETKVAAPVLGISTMGGMLPVVLLALEKYKERNPDSMVILGGTGPSNVAGEILRYFSGADVVVKGEGEETLLELISRPSDLASIDGISYRVDGEVVENPQRRRICDLDSLPLPAYGKIDMDKYLVANISTSRGCPFKCTFCEIASFWGKHVSQHSLNRVIEEIKVLRFEHHKRQINLLDDTFVLHRDRVAEFCQRLIQEGIDIQWECFGRVDLMDENLMRLMTDSGCNSIFYGIESGSDRVLKKIRKGITVEQARDTVEKSVKYFKRVVTSFVWGLPYESIEEFYDTVLLMLDFATMGAQIQRPHLSLRPFSTLYHQYKQQLAFSEKLPLYFLEVPREYIPEEVISAVKQYPSIFPGYYYVRGRDFDQKERFMRHLESLGKARWQILRDQVAAAFSGGEGS